MEIRRRTATFIGTRTRKGRKDDELSRVGATKCTSADMQSNEDATVARRNRGEARKRATRYAENPRVRIVTRVTIDGIQESSAGPINSSPCLPPPLSLPPPPVVRRTENAKANR